MEDRRGGGALEPGQWRIDAGGVAVEEWQWRLGAAVILRLV